MNPIEILKTLTGSYTILSANYYPDHVLGLTYVGEDGSWTITSANEQFSLNPDQADLYEMRLTVGHCPTEGIPTLSEQIPIAQQCMPGKILLQDTPAGEGYALVYSLRISERQLSDPELYKELCSQISEDLDFFLMEGDDGFDGDILNFDRLGASLKP